eukprot:4042823-Pleurochrysis_carterae.AAC.1
MLVKRRLQEHCVYEFDCTDRTAERATDLCRIVRGDLKGTPDPHTGTPTHLRGALERSAWRPLP